MAIKLEDKPNTEAPSVAYPYGAVKDNTGANDGTPVNKLVYDDFHQFFAKMMAASAIAYNDLPDNETDGFQYFLALLENIKKTIDAYEKVMSVDGSVKITTQIIEIGDWNMDSTATKTVAHSIDITKIISVECYIRDDSQSNVYPLHTGFNLSNPVTVPQGAIQSIGASTISLARIASGLFDFINFVSTSYNRGWVIVRYKV